MGEMVIPDTWYVITPIIVILVTLSVIAFSLVVTLSIAFKVTDDEIYLLGAMVPLIGVILMLIATITLYGKSPPKVAQTVMKEKFDLVIPDQSPQPRWKPNLTVNTVLEFPDGNQKDCVVRTVDVPADTTVACGKDLIPVPTKKGWTQ